MCPHRQLTTWSDWLHFTIIILSKYDECVLRGHCPWCMYNNQERINDSVALILNKEVSHPGAWGCEAMCQGRLAHMASSDLKGLRLLSRWWTMLWAEKVERIACHSSSGLYALHEDPRFSRCWRQPKVLRWRYSGRLYSENVGEPLPVRVDDSLYSFKQFQVKTF